jgi:hypothetical protein
MEEVNVSSMLTELAALRMQMRKFLKWKEEIESSRMNKVKYMKEAGVAEESADVGEMPLSMKVKNVISVKTFAKIVKKNADLRFDERKPVQKGNVKNKQKATLAKNDRCKLRAVVKKATLDYFVSRMEAHTSLEEMAEHVSEGLGSGAELKVEVTTLKTKFDGYASFHVSVTGAGGKISSVPEILEGDDFWPNGSYVRRFWRAKRMPDDNRTVRKEL